MPYFPIAGTVPRVTDLMSYCSAIFQGVGRLSERLTTFSSNIESGTPDAPATRESARMEIESIRNVLMMIDAACEPADAVDRPYRESARFPVPDLDEYENADDLESLGAVFEVLARYSRAKATAARSRKRGRVQDAIVIENVTLVRLFSRLPEWARW